MGVLGGSIKISCKQEPKSQASPCTPINILAENTADVAKTLVETTKGAPEIRAIV
jgi:hypothetical protein